MEFVELGAGELTDRVDPRRVLASETVYEGRIWDVVSEQVELSEGGPRMTRDFITHPGAVAILALDDQDRVLLIRQYRHPVGMTQWEIPAGILDVEGEHPAKAAARELGEEADLSAGAAAGAGLAPHAAGAADRDGVDGAVRRRPVPGPHLRPTRSGAASGRGRRAASAPGAQASRAW